MGCFGQPERFRSEVAFARVVAPLESSTEVQNMKRVSPKLRLSAAHFFSGVAIDCVIGESEEPEVPASASIRFVLDMAQPGTIDDDAAGQVGPLDNPAGVDEFVISVAADPATPASCSISCLGYRDPDRHQLAKCYREALRAADKYGARMAMVPIPSSGGTPEERVRTAVRTVRNLSGSFEHLRSIRFVADDERTFQAFRQRLAKQSGRSNGGGGWTVSRLSA